MTVRSLELPCRSYQRSGVRRWLKNGIVTYSDIYAQEGKDWEEGFEQRKREQDKIKELGLELINGNNIPVQNIPAGQIVPAGQRDPAADDGKQD